MQNQFFNNQPTAAQQLNRKYNNARNNLLLVVVFTAINLVLLVANANSYFLFSASIPYMLTDLGRFFCGMYPSEFYTENDISFRALPMAVFYVLLAIAIAIIVLYLVSYILSKKHVGWLIFALVFFSLDTLGMFLYFGISADMILDIVFHVWVLVILVQGVIAHFKLKKLPPEEELEPVVEVGEQPDGAEAPAVTLPDSPVLRAAEETKSRTLLEFESFGHKIVYRKVKKVNELVVDGNVYAEYVATIERSHQLSAVVDGHEFVVGFDSSGFSYGAADSQLVARKTRLF